jgi:hypothetical protein
MLLALESQICVVIVLRKEFNRTMTCSRSTELSCLCVKPVGGTKGQYLNEILSTTDKTWTWCCIIVSSHICWINFEPGKVSFLENNNKCFINFIQKKKNLPTYSTLQVYQLSYSQVGHIPPKMSDSLQRNVDKFESTLSKSDYLVGHRGRTWEWIFKDFIYISRGEHVKHFVIDAYL